MSGKARTLSQVCLIPKPKTGQLWDRVSPSLGGGSWDLFLFPRIHWFNRVPKPGLSGNTRADSHFPLRTCPCSYKWSHYCTDLSWEALILCHSSHPPPRWLLYPQGHPSPWRQKYHRFSSQTVPPPAKNNNTGSYIKLMSLASSPITLNV